MKISRTANVFIDTGAALFILAAAYMMLHTDQPPAQVQIADRRYEWKDSYKPEPTADHIATGTRLDPFVGDGVIVKIIDDKEHPSILLKHKLIPNFMIPMYMQAPIASRDVLVGLDEGMFVRVSFELVGKQEFQIFRIEPTKDGQAKPQGATYSVHKKDR